MLVVGVTLWLHFIILLIIIIDYTHLASPRLFFLCSDSSKYLKELEASNIELFHELIIPIDVDKDTPESQP